MNTDKTTTTASAQPENRARFYTTSAKIQGALCGHIWMPQVKATVAISEDLHARFNRFSDKSGATFRDALLSTLNEKGGDFQSAQFTADTSLVITRCKFIGGNRSTRFETRIREIPISELPDCADLVHAETYSYDFDETD